MGEQSLSGWTPRARFTGTGAIGGDVHVDYWVNVRWDPPGFMLFDAGVTPAGRDRAEGVELNSIQLLTARDPGQYALFLAAVPKLPPG